MKTSRSEEVNRTVPSPSVRVPWLYQNTSTKSLDNEKLLSYQLAVDATALVFISFKLPPPAMVRGRLYKHHLKRRLHHRYRKSLNRLLKVCYVPATSAVLISFSSYFAAAINSTNEANEADGTRR
jgi:hypothetical protein